MDTETTVSILVVDDEPGICELLTTLLESHGYRVYSCYSAKDALAAMERTTFDAVITDLRMPGMDGLTLIRQLKTRQPETAAIMITGYATVETAVDALRHGADDYVTKPFNVEELRKVVGRVVRARQLARENKQLQGRLEHIRRELRLTRRQGPPVECLDQRRWEQLCRLNTELSAFDDPDEMCRRALAVLRDEFHVASGSILLLNGAADRLHCKAALEQGKPASTSAEYPVDAGVVGWVVQHKEPLLVQDITRTPLFQDEPRERYPNGSLLCLPLLSNGTLYGVIHLTAKRENAVFSRDDQHLLSFVAAQLAASLKSISETQRRNRQALQAVRRLVEHAERRAGYATGHARRVADYAEQIARQLHVPEQAIEHLRQAAHVHDVGCVALPDALLNKPNRFSRAERDRMQAHVTQGSELLQFLGFVEDARDAVRHHHERIDGRGYPDRLRGEQIPLFSRILAVAESFDAMTSPRPYRQALSRDEAVRELRRWAGRQFDPRCVQALEEALEAASPIASRDPATEGAPA